MATDKEEFLASLGEGWDVKQFPQPERLEVEGLGTYEFKVLRNGMTAPTYVVADWYDEQEDRTVFHANAPEGSGFSRNVKVWSVRTSTVDQVTLLGKKNTVAPESPEKDKYEAFSITSVQIFDSENKSLGALYGPRAVEITSSNIRVKSGFLDVEILNTLGLSSLQSEWSSLIRSSDSGPYTLMLKSQSKTQTGKSQVMMRTFSDVLFIGLEVSDPADKSGVWFSYLFEFRSGTSKSRIDVKEPTDTFNAYSIDKALPLIKNSAMTTFSLPDGSTNTFQSTT
jgi:hypothetical protein